MRRIFVAALFILLALSALSASAQTAPFAIGGTIVTPTGTRDHAWLIVRNGKSAAIADARPADPTMKVVDTSDLIFPGFIDLHNHPMYAVFPRWKPKRRFANRYEWRRDPEYTKLVGGPGHELQSDESTFCDVAEYAEVQALLGGTTAITGISPRKANPPVPSCVNGLVRNLDWYSGLYAPGQSERESNLLGITPGDLDPHVEEDTRNRLRNFDLDLVTIHVAEGSPSDPESSGEFTSVWTHALLQPRVAIIHGTALGSPQFHQMRLAGVGLIWSPRSNLELYGTTTDVLAAFRAGVTIALAPDWAVTGSLNTLGEISYANNYSQAKLDGLFSPKQLFEMATAVPAMLAGVEGRIGSLQPGMEADFFVVHRKVVSPYESLANASPQDVQLVVIAGTPIYGRERLLKDIDPNLSLEKFSICGVGRALNSAALPARPFSTVVTRPRSKMAQLGTELGPLADCADASYPVFGPAQSTPQ